LEKVPGSLSSQLQTKYLGNTGLGMKLHFMPVGNQAPPRPPRLAALTSLSTSSPDISDNALRSAT
jgi:hypothetical protein